MFRVARKTALVERETVMANVFPDLLEQDLGQSSTLLHESRYGVIGSNTWNFTHDQRYTIMAKMRLNSPTLRAKVVADSRHACG